MPDFMPGLKLAELFYREAVQPALARAFPDLVYSAARIGSGSDVLGFDTPRSTDHDWGPRLQLFLRESDHARLATAITATLREELPPTFHGWPVGFTPPDLSDGGTQALDYTGGGPVNHRVDVWTIRGFSRDSFGLDVLDELAPADWLTMTSQKLRAFTAGAVFHDEVGLAAVRNRLAWYPRDVWLYLLAAGWQRIGQEEHLMGRAGEAGDEIGSALIAARLVRDVMRLCFLMERQYAPYAKWWGTAFRELDCAANLEPALQGALTGQTWQDRETYLTVAYEYLVRMHNALGITEPVKAEVSDFFGRPFQVIWGGNFAAAIQAQVVDPAVLTLFEGPLIGSVDQFSDNVDLLEAVAWQGRLRGLY